MNTSEVLKEAGEVMGGTGRKATTESVWTSANKHEGGGWAARGPCFQ